MKVIAYLTEPASYTLDLVKCVHLPNNIDYSFIFDSSYTKPKVNEKANSYTFLNRLSPTKRFKVLKDDYIQYDAIIFNGYDSASFLLLWFVHYFSKVKKPIAIESDTPLKIPANLVKRLVKKWYLNILFSNPYLHGLAGGNNSQKELFRYYGMSSDRIHFLPMVIDVNQFKYEPSRKRRNKFTFLFVGRFIPLKQIELIIKEFLLKFQDNLEVNLILVGDGISFPMIYEKYSRFKNILFKGSLFDEDLKKEFKLAHVLVLASNNENWGLVMNEAMSASLPILSNIGIGGNHDLIDGKNTGLIFDANVKGDLSEKMNTIYEDKDLYEMYSKNAYDLMHNYWNFNLYANQLKLAISKMTNEK